MLTGSVGVAVPQSNTLYKTVSLGQHPYEDSLRVEDGREDILESVDLDQGSVSVTRYGWKSSQGGSGDGVTGSTDDIINIKDDLVDLDRDKTTPKKIQNQELISGSIMQVTHTPLLGPSSEHIVHGGQARQDTLSE